MGRYPPPKGSRAPTRIDRKQVVIPPQPAPRPAAIVEPPRSARERRWLIAAAAASGWIASLFLGLLDLPAKINGFATEQPKATERIGNWLFLDRNLSGAWSSQPGGDVIAKRRDPAIDALDGAPVEVEMQVYRGEDTGTIGSGGLARRYVFSPVQLDGSVERGHVRGSVWDVVGGQRVQLATIDLQPAERDGEPVLIFSTTGPSNRYFPSRAILWSTPAISEGEVNRDFVRAVSRAAKSVAKPEK
ncbi:hypothetical protein G4G27_07025 [Sphingomonas sp. So64.6b]|uniref:hypothetical protein n=1 Tax=Sphingomonas sp. So64.6b TaxID=2997354 RepID=UPI0016010B20|nr:hypothetical protein [Sphingomonas sp. So64.6b]QNA83768.1 hypothetical protein G4G27_07025 [Sphingomonas sp. So64.6b]